MKENSTSISRRRLVHLVKRRYRAAQESGKVTKVYDYCGVRWRRASGTSFTTTTIPTKQVCLLRKMIDLFLHTDPDS